MYFVFRSESRRGAPQEYYTPHFFRSARRRPFFGRQAASLSGTLSLGDGDGVKMENAIAKCGVLKRKAGMLRRKESK